LFVDALGGQLRGHKSQQGAYVAMLRRSLIAV
jgi:hypothetical protein